MPQPPKSKTKSASAGKKNRAGAKGGLSRLWRWPYSICLRLLRWLRFLVLAWLLVSCLAVVAYRFLPIPVTPLMLIRCGEQYATGEKMVLEKYWEPLEKISPSLAEAVTASEDQLFLEHLGFDWDAILAAFSVNSGGKRKLGASTITQQTAKNVFLWPERSWSRKILEAYFTVLIEIFWNKHRILEVYLNVIETGNGIYGAEAAARKYFAVPAQNLDEEQSALIAAILPSPRRGSPVHPTPHLLRRQAWILRQMELRGPQKF